MNPTIHIAHPTPADEADFIAASKSSVEFWGATVRPIITPEDYATILSRANTDDNQVFLIRRNTDNALVGYASLNAIARGRFQNAFIGYQAFAVHAGQGLMTPGVAAIVDRAFKTLNLHRLEANIAIGNEPSRRLIQRVGFRLEGVALRFLNVNGQWLDHERWALTND